MASNSFIAIFARNCSVRRIPADQARTFLDACHRWGFCRCRYCYGLFVCRAGRDEDNRGGDFPPGTLVAVATFSNARRWNKDGDVVTSYEWLRYASLPGTRVLGGMSKLLRCFIDEKHPDDVMTYVPVDAGAEHPGDAYVKLGFISEGQKHFGESVSLKFRLTLR